MKTEIFNLKHGGKVLFNRQKDVQGITVQFYFNGGSFNDPKGKLGVAHFCEHAFCNFPTAKMTREERSSYEQKLAFFNAFTSVSKVWFDLRMTEQDFEEAIDFLTESFISIKLTQEEFDKEKKIIEDEIKIRNKRNNFQYYLTSYREIYKDIHYKNNIASPAGTIETLSKITLDDLKEYVSQYFTLNNLIVAISGNISKKRVKQAMHKYVDARIPFSDTVPALTREVNDLYKPKFHYTKSVEKDKALLSCLYPLKFMPWKYEVYRESYIVGILNQILQEYAIQYFRQKKNLCYSCALYVCWKANQLSNEFYIECQEENIDEILDVYKEFLDSLPKDLDQKSFEEHKRRRVLQYNFDFLKIDQIADLLYRVYFDENKLYNDKYRKDVFENRKSITYQETNELYKTLFKGNPHVTLITNDEKYKDFDYKSFVKTAQK